mmetsp:Transcript_73961/g.164342  ORF Transcript_73961/g.164342 Transcript_73961/m.164342 type:complete len:256 (-) Transcript_73961:263-1030(-)
MMKHVLLLIAFLPICLAGVCTCSCCARMPAGPDCQSVQVGINTVDSCLACSTSFCASRFPSACPAQPNVGGMFGAGGHTSFTCSGTARDSTPQMSGAVAEEGGGGLFILILLIAFCCLGCRRKRGAAQQHDYVAMPPTGFPIPPAMGGYHGGAAQGAYPHATYAQGAYPQQQQQPVYSQPMYSQPVYSQPVYSQPVYSQPVYNQPAVQHSSGALPAVAGMAAGMILGGALGGHHHHHGGGERREGEGDVFCSGGF